MAADPQTAGPVNDMWRVDVAGYACMVRGRGTKEHLERINGELARLKMALHRIVKLSDGHAHAVDIAEKALSND